MLAVPCQEAFQQYCHGLQAEQVLACRKPAGHHTCKLPGVPSPGICWIHHQGSGRRGGVGGDEQIFSMLLLE